MTWRKLEPCFKWMKLKDYLGRRGLDADSKQAGVVRTLLVARQLTMVEYDARGQAVLKLNHDDCRGIDDMDVLAPPTPPHPTQPPMPPQAQGQPPPVAAV